MIKIIRLCKDYFIKYKYKMSIFGFMVLLSGATTFLIPIISSNFLDFLVYTKDENRLYHYCIRFGIVSVGGIIIGFAANRIYLYLNSLIVHDLNVNIIRKAQKLPISFFENRDIARVTQQINVDTQSLVSFCFDTFQNGTLNVLKLIIPMFILSFVNKSVVIILFFLTFIYCICYLAFKKRIYNVTFEAKENQNGYFSKLHEQLSKIRYIKIHGLVNSFYLRLNIPFKKMLASVMTLQKVQYLYSSLDSLTMSMGQILLFIVSRNLE
ncbi:ABC-type bacteriocin/lantibiotic exporter with double-glycine peptidase domain [Lachnospiraceae bacterium PF1-21]